MWNTGSQDLDFFVKLFFLFTGNWPILPLNYFRGGGNIKKYISKKFVNEFADHIF